MSCYTGEIICDEPGRERVEVYEVAALGKNGKLVNVIVGAAAREYIDRAIADWEEREYVPPAAAPEGFRQ